MKQLLYCLCVISLIACQSETDSTTDEVDNTTETDLPDESEIADTSIPMDMGLRKLQPDDLPACDYDGYLIDCWYWEDKNGDNYLFRSVEEIEQVESSYDGEVPDGFEFYSQSLHVYHYLELKEMSELILKRDLNDFVKECEFDLNVEHLEDVELNDADNDNFGEITFGYRLACRSDVSPSDFKVVTFEDGEKYILRGSAVALGYGGDYEPGKEFDSAPEGFLQNATNYWEDNKVEFEITE